MNITAALLLDLRRRGVVLRREGHHLGVDAPKGALTATDHAALRAHKAAVLELLRLETTYAGLTPEERTIFAADVAAGDPLALVVADLLGEGGAGLHEDDDG